VRNLRNSQTPYYYHTRCIVKDFMHPLGIIMWHESQVPPPLAPSAFLGLVYVLWALLPRAMRPNARTPV
jgi:hypothetical protein